MRKECKILEFSARVGLCAAIENRMTLRTSGGRIRVREVNPGGYSSLEAPPLRSSIALMIRSAASSAKGIPRACPPRGILTPANASHTRVPVFTCPVQGLARRPAPLARDCSGSVIGFRLSDDGPRRLLRRYLASRSLFVPLCERVGRSSHLLANITPDPV